MLRFILLFQLNYINNSSRTLLVNNQLAVNIKSKFFLRKKVVLITHAGD